MNVFIMQNSIVRPLGRDMQNVLIGFVGEHEARTFFVRTRDDLTGYTVGLVIDDVDCGAMTKAPMPDGSTMLSLTLTSDMLGRGGDKVCQLLMVKNTIVRKSSQFRAYVGASNDINSTAPDSATIIIISEKITELVHEAALDAIAEVQEVIDSIPPDYSALSDDVTQLKADLDVNFDLFGCHDLLRQFANYRDITKDGVTFNWNTNKTECTVNGTATTTTCFCALYSSTNTLPSQLKAGETYIFRVHTTDPIRLRFYIYQYHSDPSLNGYTFVTEDAVITLPSTLIGMVLRIQVISNTSVSNDKISVFITKTKSNTELTSALNMLPQPKGILPSDVALNNVTDSGVWLLASEYEYTDSPLPHGKAGVLEVVKTNSRIILQRITRYDGKCVYYRTTNAPGSFVDRAWTELNNGDTYNNNYITEVYNNSYDVTCSPTITTDTNNFLASTGDTTDRTSAIQAMLNGTGICRLGAGDFYVTGVSIPDFGSLVGSGNATRLILDSSVTNGCAINLGNNCTVRDMRIVGKATGTYTGQATVGTRHGILWTATADAESPTRKFRCIIDNCQFWHFAGGAITCSNVGGNIDSNLLVSNCFIYGCDAGINIAYYSEFHRMTNVSATHCYYGCICNGGNCNFVNCSFSYNMVGILMDNSMGQSPNNSHGVFSACTICHSGSNNDGIAIKVLGCANGEIFTGLQVHFGSIIVDDSKAIRFVACQFGRNVPMTLTDNTLITFADCSVSDTSSPTITQNGNTTIVFDRCYKYDGTIFNPVP